MPKVAAKKIVEESESEMEVKPKSSRSSHAEAKAPKKKVVESEEKPKKTKKKVVESDSESDSEAEVKPKKTNKKVVESESDDEEPKKRKTPVKREHRDAEEILEELTALENLVHELKVDLRKAIGGKGLKKKSSSKKEKGDVPKQLSSWFTEVNAVKEEYAEEGKKITHRDAMRIAANRRDGKDDDAKRPEKKKKATSDDEAEEKPKKKKAESDDEAEEKPKKKATSDDEAEKPKKKKKAVESDDEAEKPKKKKKATSDDEAEKPVKKAKKAAKVVEPEEVETEEWMYEGKTYAKDSNNGVWMPNEDGSGTWVGVYDPAKDEIDTSAPEPTA
jgi:hypothetical protein